MGLSKKRELRIAQEGSFAENATSVGSITWTVSGTVLRPKVYDIDTTGLKLEGLDDIPAMGDIRRHLAKVTTVYSGSVIKFKHALTGLGGSGATGAVTTTELGTILSWVLGGESKTDGTTIAGAGATTTVLPLTSAGSYAAGEFVLLANEGHRRITAKSGSDVTLHHALSGAPANLTVVYGTAAYYCTEATPTTLRLLVFGDTGDASNQITAVGCVGKIGFEGLNPGSIPYITFEFHVAYWTKSALSQTFTTAAFDDKTISSPGGAGLYFNESGTTTRNNVQAWDFSCAPVIERTKDIAAGGIANVAGTDVQGWSTTDIGATGSFKTPFALDWYTRWRTNTTTSWNLLYQGCATPGKAWAIYLPTVFPAEEPPDSPIGDKSGNEVKFVADRGADCSGITTDVAYAPFVVVLG